jgi:hypothetical protein
LAQLPRIQKFSPKRIFLPQLKSENLKPRLWIGGPSSPPFMVGHSMHGHRGPTMGIYIIIIIFNIFIS